MLRRLLILIAALFAAPAPAERPTILVLGDSLSAAYGIDPQQGWVELLRQRLHSTGYPHTVVNASISGDTTAGGLARLGRALRRHQPVIVILELGGNDGLRALSLSQIKRNLAAMIEQAQTQDAQVLLVGMHIPPNYGSAYTERFHALYGELARQYEIPLVPFLLAGVAEQRALMQGDGIHPRPEAQPLILDNLWPHLEPLLGTTEAGTADSTTPLEAGGQG